MGDGTVGGQHEKAMHVNFYESSALVIVSNMLCLEIRLRQ
jgi:hypothetical protein